MAFGVRKQPQSYGVPVRAASPPPPAAYAPQEAAVAAPFAAAGAGYAPAPSGPPQYARQGWAPPPAPPGSYAPVPPYAPYTGKNKSPIRKPFAIAGGIVLALILLAAAFDAFKQQSQLKPPAVLAGRTITTDPVLLQTAKDDTKKMRSQNGGHGATATFYVDADGNLDLVLIAVRGVSREDRDLRDLEAGGVPMDRASVQTFGDVSCYAAGRGAVCLWHGGISGAVATVRSPDLGAAAAIAAEARSALH